MTHSRQEIERSLLAGKAVGSIRLGTPQQRRLLHFLLRSSERSTGNFSDSYIEEMKSTFSSNDGTEFAAFGADSAPSIARRQWRLLRIETDGFGGLNAAGSRPFSLDLDGKSICAEGYNGRGKTSLASSIVWALTGCRLRCQSEPDAQSCEPHPVRSADDRSAKAKNWPPTVAYPTTFQEISRTSPRAMVRLTFSDGSTTASLVRKLEAQGTEVEGLEDLNIPDILVEIAVLMPNRIPHIRIGDDRRVVEILVQLIGLEPLRDLGEHVKALCHRAKNFAGYPKKADLDSARQKLSGFLITAEKVIGSHAELSDIRPVEQNRPDEIITQLQTTSAELSKRKTKVFAEVQGDVGAGLDLGEPAAQNRIQQAAGRLQDKLSRSGMKDYPSVRFLSRLERAIREGEIETFAQAVLEAEADLSAADSARKRQMSDTRLRLKAAAAEWHQAHHPGSTRIDSCPLCQQAFDSEGLYRLGDEIQSLKNEADVVRRSYDESLMQAMNKLREKFPKALPPNDVPHDGNVNAQLVRDLTEFLRKDVDLGSTLPKARDHALEVLHARAHELHAAVKLDQLGETQDRQLPQLLRSARVLMALADWWPRAQKSYGTLIDLIFGKADDGGNYPDGTLQAALAKLLSVVGLAKPIDEALSSVKAATDAATLLKQLSDEHDLRERIVSALEPLKELTSLVESEAAQALRDVSGAARKIFSSIYQPTSLAFDSAGIGKKGVLEVEGIVGEDLLIDATLVANASWLRAFLWSFVFALREMSINRLGYNPLPLLVLDDPQTTFDQTHVRQWSAFLAEMTTPGANSRFAQLFVTSYDTKLLDKMKVHGFQGRRITLNGIDPRSGTLSVLEGDEIVRKWREFLADGRHESAQFYIARLREYIEGQLSLMLHGFGVKIISPTIRPLLNSFEERKNVPPFSSPTIRSAVEALSIRRPFLDILNNSHHEADRRNLGPADARAVKKDWDDIEAKLEAAFEECREYEYFGPRAPVRAPYTRPSATLPTRLIDVSRPMRFEIAGRVAAATDGRVTLTQATDRRDIHFPNHAAVILSADTIYPVAAIGDVLLIRQHHEPRDGDLVIAAVDDRIYVRRVKFSGDDTIVLIAHSTDPRIASMPVVRHRQACKMKIIDGVIFTQGQAPQCSGPDEACEVQNDIDLMKLTGGRAEVFQVIGDSASPLALDGQYLLVDKPAADRTSVRRLDGSMVLATTEAGGEEQEHYFKRLHITDRIAILESITRESRFPPIPVSMAEGEAWPALTSVARVNGVLFTPATARVHEPDAGM